METQEQTEARQRWMGLAAKAPVADLAALLPDLPAHELLRGPEVGTVMVRGRAGAWGRRSTWAR